MFVVLQLSLGFLLQFLYGQESCTFRAAVYEHAPQRTINLYSTMLANVGIYSEQARHASLMGANIIVFPEYGITDVGLDVGTVITPDVYQVVTDPNERIWNPCLENTTAPNTLIVYHLSCMARNNGIYVVANLPTQVKCTLENDTKCPSEGAYLYNTDVAFNTEGTVVSRYHKQNLYNEFNLDVPHRVEYAFFDTPFGRMGMVTCFDLIWYDPLIPLVTTYNIDTLLFPTAWMDQLPYLASVQSQEAYSLGLGVNLLAANIHRPLGGFTGSGIYSPITGAVNYTYDPNSGGKLLIGDLKCTAKNQDGGGYEMERRQFQNPQSKSGIEHTMKYEELDKYNDTNLSSLSGLSEICHGDHCCQIEYEMASFPEHGLYKLMAYSGGISEGDIYTLQAEVCAVMWCQTDDKDTCSRVPTNITSNFRSLSLSGQFTTEYLYPSMFSAKMTLFPKSNWQFNKTATNPTCSWVSCANLNVFNPQVEPLLVASIYGRKYDDDCWPACN